MELGKWVILKNKGIADLLLFKVMFWYRELFIQCNTDSRRENITTAVNIYIYASQLVPMRVCLCNTKSEY